MGCVRVDGLSQGAPGIHLGQGTGAPGCLGATKWGRPLGWPSATPASAGGIAELGGAVTLDSGRACPDPARPPGRGQRTGGTAPAA